MPAETIKDRKAIEYLVPGDKILVTRDPRYAAYGVGPLYLSRTRRAGVEVATVRRPYLHMSRYCVETDLGNVDDVLLGRRAWLAAG